MYNKIFLGIFFCLLSLSGMARTISLDVTLVVYEEFNQEEYEETKAMADGWMVVKNDPYDATFRQTFHLKESDIPFRKWLGSAWVAIDKNFVLSTGISVGDADYGSQAHFEIPWANGKILPLGPVTLKCSGGDYASGMWSFDSQVRVTIF